MLAFDRREGRWSRDDLFIEAAALLSREKMAESNELSTRRADDEDEAGRPLFCSSTLRGAFARGRMLVAPSMFRDEKSARRFRR